MSGPGNRQRGRGGTLTSDDQPSWDELREQAADWLAGMDSGTADREEFEAWRNADPRHAVAFVQVANSLGALDRAKPALRGTFPPVRQTSRRAMIFGSASLAVAAIGAGAYGVATAKTSLTTRVGERRQVRLPGGEAIDLNTDSHVQWRQREDVLDVWLLRGEVALDLTGSHSRCRLHASGRVAEFERSKVNARLRGSLLDLAVVKGDCAVKPEERKLAGAVNQVAPTIVPQSHAVLANLSQVVVRPLDDADTASLAGWPNGDLVFQGQTLETATAEYNRYLTRKIVIADASLAGTRLGGRFTSQDPSAFLAALHSSFGIRVIDDGVGNIALTK